MARTKKHVPEMTKPVKKPRAYALRYPLPICEIADGELMKCGVDTLETKADSDRKEKGRSKALSFAMRKCAAETSQPVKIPPLYVRRYPLLGSYIADELRLSSYVLHVPVDALNTTVIGHDGFPGGCTKCRADGAEVYVRDCLHAPQQHLVPLFGVALGTSLHINHTTTLTITLNHIMCSHLLDAAEAHDDAHLDDLPDLV
jgi:hypothetical protein